jgi:hypothetical protein
LIANATLVMPSRTEQVSIETAVPALEEAPLRFERAVLKVNAGV